MFAAFIDQTNFGLPNVAVDAILGFRDSSGDEA
jgi:hypothetical protein